MRNIPFLTPLLFIASAVFAVPCYAEQETDDADLGGFIAGPKWKESNAVIPDFPKQDDLLMVEVDKADSPFNYFIDTKNVSISSDGGVIRYSVVIQSDSGAKNVIYEGIRCKTAEFRIYAFGSYDNKFVKARTSEWKLIQNNAAMAHRYNLYTHYMCNEYQTHSSIDIVLQKIRYPEHFEVSGERDD